MDTFNVDSVSINSNKKTVYSVQLLDKDKVGSLQSIHVIQFLKQTHIKKTFYCYKPHFQIILLSQFYKHGRYDHKNLMNCC